MRKRETVKAESRKSMRKDLSIAFVLSLHRYSIPSVSQTFRRRCLSVIASISMKREIVSQPCIVHEQTSNEKRASYMPAFAVDLQPFLRSSSIEKDSKYLAPVVDFACEYDYVRIFKPPHQ